MPQREESSGEEMSHWKHFHGQSRGNYRLHVGKNDGAVVCRAGQYKRAAAGKTVKGTWDLVVQGSAYRRRDLHFTEWAAWTYSSPFHSPNIY